MSLDVKGFVRGRHSQGNAPVPSRPTIDPTDSMHVVSRRQAIAEHARLPSPRTRLQHPSSTHRATSETVQDVNSKWKVAQGHASNEERTGHPESERSNSDVFGTDLDGLDRSTFDEQTERDARDLDLPGGATIQAQWATSRQIYRPEVYNGPEAAFRGLARDKIMDYISDEAASSGYQHSEGSDEPGTTDGPPQSTDSNQTSNPTVIDPQRTTTKNVFRSGPDLQSDRLHQRITTADSHLDTKLRSLDTARPHDNVEAITQLPWAQTQPNTLSGDHVVVRSKTQATRKQGQFIVPGRRAEVPSLSHHIPWEDKARNRKEEDKQPTPAKDHGEENESAQNFAESGTAALPPEAHRREKTSNDGQFYFPTSLLYPELPAHKELTAVDNIHDQFIDYPRSVLFDMSYQELASQPFDEFPASAPSVLPPSHQNAGLSNQLTYVLGLAEEKQRRFCASMSTEEWEQSGEWFVEQFTEFVQRLKDARREKRKLTTAFEREISERERQVRLKTEDTDSVLSGMKQGGLGVLGRTSS